MGQRGPLPARPFPAWTCTRGDYLLAVNGVPLEPTKDPWAAFQGLADKTVSLTVNEKPSLDSARDVLVETLGERGVRLRNLAWIEANRRKVDEATHGRVGYVYVPSTGIDGQNELVRMFAGQATKEGLIVDERFNSGGQIPDRFVELLNRPVQLLGRARRHDWQWPPVAHVGPKVMLINGWSGSGGDCFPFYFRAGRARPADRHADLGRTDRDQRLAAADRRRRRDRARRSGSTALDGQWIVEGHGVDPDIEVIDDPARWRTAATRSSIARFARYWRPFRRPRCGARRERPTRIDRGGSGGSNNPGSSPRLGDS